mmetsp:Transcript_13221/g.56319  ORF Transcript_13221/g.56319 Transcript_13221/m.56319 type:complete len:242 (-) Transcript_13221:448-1173(-)
MTVRTTMKKKRRRRRFRFVSGSASRYVVASDASRSAIPHVACRAFSFVRAHRCEARSNLFHSSNTLHSSASSLPSQKDSMPFAASTSELSTYASLAPGTCLSSSIQAARPASLSFASKAAASLHLFFMKLDMDCHTAASARAATWNGSRAGPSGIAIANACPFGTETYAMVGSIARGVSSSLASFVSVSVPGSVPVPERSTPEVSPRRCASSSGVFDPSRKRGAIPESAASVGSSAARVCW